LEKFSFEDKKSLQTPNLPGFYARGRSGMELSNIFWAEKLILVVIYQFLPRKAKMHIYALDVSMIQLLIAKLLGDPFHFYRPKLPVD
jgi:hypothetical protein